MRLPRNQSTRTVATCRFLSSLPFASSRIAPAASGPPNHSRKHLAPSTRHWRNVRSGSGRRGQSVFDALSDGRPRLDDGRQSRVGRLHGCARALARKTRIHLVLWARSFPVGDNFWDRQISSRSLLENALRAFLRIQTAVRLECNSLRLARLESYLLEFGT